MTGWHLKPGYSSTASDDVVWCALKEVVARLREDTSRIAGETARLRGLFVSQQILDYAAMFRTASPDRTLTVIEGDDRQVMLLASGGGESRLLKEETRRAFCRIVLAEMHARGLDVSLAVA